jgi:hypothetical protein
LEVLVVDWVVCGVCVGAEEGAITAAVAMLICIDEKGAVLLIMLGMYGS